MCVHSCVQSLISNYFDCNRKIQTKPFDLVDIEPKYKFNCAEKVGNALLLPITYFAIKFADSNSTIVKIGLAIAAIFAAIIGLMGLTVKKIGELANSNAESRQKAIAKLYEAQSKLREITGEPLEKRGDAYNAAMRLYVEISDPVPVMREFRTLFHDKILAKKGITMDDTYYLSMNVEPHDAQKGESLDERQKRLSSFRPIYEQWNQAWQAILQKAPTYQDITKEAQVISDLTKEDMEVHQKVMTYLNAVPKMPALIKLLNEYNAIIDGMK
jgi:hypothetical protein